jgi:hypothetical protein
MHARNIRNIKNDICNYFYRKLLLYAKIVDGVKSSNISSSVGLCCFKCGNVSSFLHTKNNLSTKILKLLI